jgi:radical SAM modification target selenobiotic family peptide
MDKNELKKILAGISLASLLAGAGFAPSVWASNGQGS